MEKGYLNQVKAILKSLVLSSPDQITVDQLNRDYRDIEGEFIPFQRLGFNNLELFLRSIPDTLCVFGSGHSASVYFVSNEKSKHIHNMIMEQKKPKSTPRSRSFKTNQMQMPPMQKHSNRNNNSFQAANVQRRMPGQQFSAHQVTHRNVSTRTVTVRDVPPIRQQINTNVDQQHTATCVTGHTAYALPQPVGIHLNSLNSTQARHIQTKTAPQAGLKTDAPPRLETRIVKFADATNSAKYQEEINKIQSLLTTTCHVTAPKSIGTVKSVSFSPEIKSEMISKTSPIKEIEATTTDGLHAPKPKVKMSEEVKKILCDQPMARSKSNPIRAEVEYEEEDHKELECPTKTEDDIEITKFKKLLDISDSRIVDIDEAIPAFAANNQVFRVDFPQYTVPYGRKLLPFQVPESIQVNSRIGIFISEIHNPYKFWFHIHKEEHELDILMNQIERFYTSLAPNELRIPIVCLNPGQVCAACYNGMWHRAEIVSPPVNNCIKVSFSDYGTVSEVNILEIKYLATCFAQLPVQALRGCLSHIKPPGLHWIHDATTYFLYLVAEKMLYAKITEIDKENSVFYMILCDTHGDEVLQINTELVIRRYAIYNVDWQESKIAKNNGRRIRHPREDYPTFSMIETGEYPSFTELVELEQRGIDYETIHDRVIFNKCAILNFNESVPEPIRQLPFFLQTSNPFRTDILLELMGINATNT